MSSENALSRKPGHFFWLAMPYASVLPDWARTSASLPRSGQD